MNIAHKLLSSLTGSFAGGSVAQSLLRLASERVPVRLEIENTGFSFYTVLSLRPQGVLLGRPPDIEDDMLEAGDYVRFPLPDGSLYVVRMEVIKPCVERERGDTVILCAMPEEFTPKSKRKFDRFHTARYNNLSLRLLQFEAPFRILDISRHGCKVLLEQMEGWNEFRLGQPMRFAKVEVGSKGVLDLAYLTPRYIKPPVVSFQWGLANKNSAQTLEHLIRTLHSEELGRLKVAERNPPNRKIKAQA